MGNGIEHGCDRLKADIDKYLRLHSDLLAQKHILPKAEYEGLMEYIGNKMEDIISKIH